MNYCPPMFDSSSFSISGLKWYFIPFGRVSKYLTEHIYGRKEYARTYRSIGFYHLTSSLDLKFLMDTLALINNLQSNTYIPNQAKLVTINGSKPEFELTFKSHMLTHFFLK